MAEMERVYTVPLREAYEHTRSSRTRRAVKELKGFIARHMKVEPEKVRLSEALNEHIWSSGMKKCPRRVKIRVRKEEGVVKAFLFTEKKEGKKEEKAEKAAEAKAEAKAEEKKGK